MTKILCTIEPFSPEAQSLLEGVGEVTTNVAEADVLIVQLGKVIDQELIDSAPNLKLIATATTGLRLTVS